MNWFRTNSAHYSVVWPPHPVHPDCLPSASASDVAIADQFTHDTLFAIRTLVDAGNFDEALVLHDEILKARRSVYKPDSPPIGSSWSAIGSVYMKAGRLDEAEEPMRKAYEI